MGGAAVTVASHEGIGRDPNGPVFVVNDDVETAEAIKALLEHDGYSVETALDGGAALRKLRDGLRPCIIVLDLMMPVVDGYQFRAAQLKDDRLAEIPVIVCSALVNPSMLDEQLRAEAYANLVHGAEVLRGLVHRHCRR
jgi:CheY-like chemotaxis protein